MLREIQPNAVPAREANVFADVGKHQEMRNSESHSTLLTASAQQLPSSDDEENLEDFSGSEDEEKPPICPVPRRRLVPLNQGAPRAAIRKDSSALVDDVLDGMASLGIGSRSSNAAPTKPRPSTAAAPVVAAAPIAEESDDDDEDSGSDDDDEDSGSDDASEPFFERLAPSAETRAAAASSSDTSQPEPGALVLGERNKYVLAAAVAKKLFPHQVTGVRWLWTLFEKQRGGILGDDMGLGKTMQCAAFLAGLFSSRLVRRVLIIAPKTLLPHWIKELSVVGLRTLTREFFGSSESERSASLRSVVNGRGIIVTTYGMVQHNSKQLAGPARSISGEPFGWDVMLLDEGHKIKNPKMKLVEELHKLPARVRVIISGTPIQNNLMEMHSLFDFTTEGLLGDFDTFRKHYERPITKGLDRTASDTERKTGAAIAAELRQRVEPFFLRREKKDVLPDNNDNDANASGSTAEDEGDGGTGGAGSSASAGASSSGAPSIGQRAKGLPRKNDLVVWLRLTPLQSRIYTTFLHTDSVRQVLNEKASPLAAITILKKICDHPALLTQRAATSVIAAAHRWAKEAKSGRKGGRRRQTDDFIADSDEDLEASSDGGSSSEDERSQPASRRDEPSVEWLGDGASLDKELTRELEQRGAEASCKSVFVLALLERLHEEGHRTLIFSQSKVMLSILEAGIKAMKLAYCRIDGDIVSAEERHAYVQRFQENDDIPVFLLTSQVGGLGLTLTAADRVIIVDPAWNPSIDNQSVDRAYRMGQTRNVVVYRLVTCGTVEEKIYRKQVFKGGLSRTGTEEGIQFRYFSQTELSDLFKVDEEGLRQSATQVQLNDMHEHQRTATEGLQRHLEQVLRMENVAGIHDHNLLFTQRPKEQAPTAQEGAAILSQMSRSGPVGVDALTSMLGSGMRIGSNAANTKHQAAVDQALRKACELGTRLRHMQSTSAAALAAKLPDGGARIKESVALLERQHKEALAALAALEAGGDMGSGSAAASGQGAAGSSQGTAGSSQGTAGSSQGTAGSSRIDAVGPSRGAAATGGNNDAGSGRQRTGAADANAHRVLPSSLGSSAGAIHESPPGPPQVQRPVVRPGGFGAGVMSRAPGGGSSSSGGAPGAHPEVRGQQPLDQQLRLLSAAQQAATDSARQQQQPGRGATGAAAYSGAMSAQPRAGKDADEVSFVTADSTEGPDDEDTANSHVIDLTDTP